MVSCGTLRLVVVATVAAMAHASCNQGDQGPGNAYCGDPSMDVGCNCPTWTCSDGECVMSGSAWVVVTVCMMVCIAVLGFLMCWRSKRRARYDDTSAPLTGVPVPLYGSGQPYGQPAYGQPVYGEPAYGVPADGQPVYGQPAYGQPVYNQAQPATGNQECAQVNTHPQPTTETPTAV